jgi:hypothetical protein
MSKFLLNLLLQISKVLVNSKNPILIQKFFFLAFGPANLAACSASGPAHPPAAPSPQAETIPAGPSSPRVSRVFVGIRFPFWFVPSRAGCLSLVSLSSCVFPTAPTNPGHFLPSPPATPRRPTSDLEMPVEVFTPCLDSPP